MIQQCGKVIWIEVKWVKNQIRKCPLVFQRASCMRRKEESPQSQSQDFAAILLKRRFMSQARRTRHFERSARNVRKMPCSPRLGHKALVMQATSKPELLSKRENNCLNLMAYRDYHRNQARFPPLSRVLQSSLSEAGGGLNRVLYRDALPQGPTPYPVIYSGAPLNGQPLYKDSQTDNFLCPQGKLIHFSQNSNRLIRTPVNEDNVYLFLAQWTDSHRKSTSLMQTLCVVTNLSLLRVKQILQITACRCSR